jgi:ATP-dependent RNA helicase DeaD
MSTTDGFESLGLTRKTLKGVEEAGFESPTPVQAQTIPILMSGSDLIAEAQTGTGKTAAFALPILERLQPGKKTPQALILCPTRELAVQVSEAIYTLGRTADLRVLPVYGGQPFERQLRALRAGVAIVVGTPGRLLDHIRRKTLKLDAVKMVVLDEADEMLAMGFIDDIKLVFDELPESRQIALFSATMPAPIVHLAGKYLRDAKQVTIASKPQNTPKIRQSYYEVSWNQKVDALTRILDMETPGPTIIFCNTKRETDMLGDHLRGRGYPSDTLHGDLSQQARDKVMARFREGQVDVLVATDVAARGLDIKSVTHVINYDVPWDAESYTHRIGRTGRAGRQGDAITLVSAREMRLLRIIEKGTRSKIRPVRLPTIADVAIRRREVFKQSVIDGLKEGGFEDFLVTVDELAENHQPSEVAAVALKLLWAQQKSATASPTVEPAQTRQSARVRLFLTAGRQHGLRPGDVVGAIANEAGIKGDQIGPIHILDDTSFVEVPADKAQQVIEALTSTRLRGVKVNVGEAPEDFVPPPRDSKPQFQGKKTKKTKKNRSAQ